VATVVDDDDAVHDHVRNPLRKLARVLIGGRVANRLRVDAGHVGGEARAYQPSV
jgi:hypothetical protein